MTRAVVSLKERNNEEPEFRRSPDQGEGLMHEKLKLDLRSRLLEVVP